MKLAIIGTAGRGLDGNRLASNPKLYIETMKRAAIKVAELTGSTVLVSGGAAWADHIAVALHQWYPSQFGLELELPAPLDIEVNRIYRDTGARDSRANPGGTANHYHRLFQSAVQTYDPYWRPWLDFSLLSAATKITVTPGFLERNLVVASKADHVLAMTFGEGREVKDGGTAHTMRHFLRRTNRGQAYHLNLNTLKLYDRAAA